MLSMKQYTPGILAVLLFAAMLLSPKAVFNGAAGGLMLWFQIILPTLFPFMLISSVMLCSGGLRIVSRLLGRISSRIFATSRDGSFAVLTGFLCGYPMGAKTAADLCRLKIISYQEAGYLLSFCNNTSPVFIVNFIVWKTLETEELILPSLLILSGTPVVLSFVFRRYYLGGAKNFAAGSKSLSEKKRPFDLTVFDKCMMDSFESVLNVGGYIIFFSVLISILEKAAGDIPAVTFLMPALEITNGIRYIADRIDDITLSFPLILGLTSFGGFCSAAQTQCMLKGTGLPLFPYLMQKLAAALTASLTGLIYMSLFWK